MSQLARLIISTKPGALHRYNKALDVIGSFGNCADSI